MPDFAEKMSKLTPRELQICEVLKQKPDLTYRAIGQRLNPRISEYGVDFHLRNIYNKTGIDNKYILVANLRGEAKS